MAILTSTDQAKTIAEYLGITGTPDEVIKQLEESEHLPELLTDIFGADSQAYLIDGSHRAYPFVVRQLCASSASMTIGNIMTDKERLNEQLQREYGDILKDYSENSNQKSDLFLKAVSFSSSVDGDGFDRKSFFFRYWRSPLQKLLNYRGIDPSTPDGEMATKKILHELYSTHLEEEGWRDLIQETPEHLVEQREELQERQREKARDQEMLEMQTFAQIWTYKAGIYFSSAVAVDLSGLSGRALAEEIVKYPKAHELMKQYLRTKEPLDVDLFEQTLTLKPLEVQDRRDGFVKPLKQRNDVLYLNSNPGVSFQKFVNDRYFLPVVEQVDEQAAMQSLLKTAQRMDGSALRYARRRTCEDILANRDKLIEGLNRRKKLRTVGGLIGSLLLVGILSTFGYRSVTAMKESKAAKKAAVTQRAVSPKNAEKVQKQMKKVTWETGNTPILMDWKGYHDIGYRLEDKTAQERVLTGEYTDMLMKMQQTGKTFGDLFNPLLIRQSLDKNDNYIYPAGHGSQKIYIKMGTAGQVLADVENYLGNINQTLAQIPVKRDKLASAQVIMMDVVGPSIGWSKEQQKIWQNQHPEESRRIQSKMIKETQKLMHQRQIKSNDKEGVFWAIVGATAKVRQSAPNYPAFSLHFAEIFESVLAPSLAPQKTAALEL